MTHIYVQKTPHKINQLNKEEMFSFPKEKKFVDGLCFYGIQVCICQRKDDEGQDEIFMLLHRDHLLISFVSLVFYLYA